MAYVVCPCCGQHAQLGPGNLLEQHSKKKTASSFTPPSRRQDVEWCDCSGKKYEAIPNS